MRRFFALAGAVLLLAAVAGPAVAATGTFKAVIHEDFGKRASARACFPVTGGFACEGDGNVDRYGRVDSLIVFPDDPNLPLRRTLTFGDGSTLVTNEVPNAVSRFPGRSQDARDGDHGYGNPAFDHYDWVIVGGTGRFAGASGSGTWANVLAGDTIVIKFTGTLTLP